MAAVSQTGRRRHAQPPARGGVPLSALHPCPARHLVRGLALGRQPRDPADAAGGGPAARGFAQERRDRPERGDQPVAAGRQLSDRRLPRHRARHRHGLSPLLDDLLDPIVEMLRPISGIAWIPLALFIFGIGDTLPIFIMAYVALFPFLLNTMAGVRSTDRTAAAGGADHGRGRRDDPPARRPALGPAAHPDGRPASPAARSGWRWWRPS